MTLRKSPKSIEPHSTLAPELTNKELAVQLVTALLSSGNSSVISKEDSAVHTKTSLLARSNLEAFYITSLYFETEAWLKHASINKIEK
jgi:hypothetical protein